MVNNSDNYRNFIDGLMDTLYAGGVNNPADSIEQISYLLFIKLLHETDSTNKLIDKNYESVFTGELENLKWSILINLTGNELVDKTREAFTKMASLPGLSDTGKVLFRQAYLKILDPPTLRTVIQGIESMKIDYVGISDPKGDMYEYLLSKLETSGTNGQFRTPRHIIDVIVCMVDPKPMEKIIDPAAGSAGFLLSAHNHILKTNTPKSDLDRNEITGNNLSASEWAFIDKEAYTGFDNDANMIKLGIMNLYLHKLENADFSLHNPITTTIGGSYPGKKYNVILANPPFAGRLQDESILSDLNHGLNTKATELLFLKWFIDHLENGGRAGVIVPQGVLTGSSKAHKALKKSLLENNNLTAIIDLPGGVFNPYSGVSTAILIFSKGGSTDSVWFYKVNNDGFSLNTNRDPIEENDLKDLCEKFSSKEEGDNSINVKAQEIIDNDYSLNINNYLIPEEEIIEYPPPSETIAKLKNIQKEIDSLLDDLEKEL